MTKVLAVVLAASVAWLLEAQTNIPAPPAQDYGVRGGQPDAGDPFSNLSTPENNGFNDGQSRFNPQNLETVAQGLGPTFNGRTCATCHSQPAVGGSSPAQNPQIAQAPQGSTIPTFLTQDGPVVEARFQYWLNPNTNPPTVTNVRDGSVHDLFTITGLSGEGTCTNYSQPPFALEQSLGNVSLRIPTPVFGLGLIETITEEMIIKNMNANGGTKQQLGIAGVPNRSGNDGTITRFGWKAQNKSGQIFAGEAYNVEMGVTNEEFPNERGNSPYQNEAGDPPTTCLLNPTPEDATNFGQSGLQLLSDIVEFSSFMRFLDQPKQDPYNIPGNPTQAQINDGQTQFNRIGCNMCHTPSLMTGQSSYDDGANQTPFLTDQTANLYSDLLIHHMGGLADNIQQGLALGDQFRTAPLWGVGQRIFFLHDGRATPSNGGLLTAIQDHNLPVPGNSNYPPSEAAAVIGAFNGLTNAQQQDILFFLRSL
ncbi:MAG TPA: di-heme oxidoredictase family protein [Bryobacteraceae bacterium]|jgi:CxxC motif-containing protein (DUF1111 family)|nr:di-heme oxidoredictase family protein [Bryobacteraceae bacterium]